MEKEINSPLKEIVEKSNLRDLVCINVMDIPIGKFYWLKPTINMNSIDSSESILLTPIETVIQTETYRVSLSFSEDTKNDIDMKFGIDSESISEGVLISESSRSLLKIFLNKMYQLANTTYLDSYTRWDKFKAWLWNILGKKYEKTIEIKNHRDLIKQIQIHSNRIHRRSRLGPAQFVICNSKTANLLSDSCEYVYEKTSILQRSASDLYLHGYLADIKIFANPLLPWDDNTVYLGRIAGESDFGPHLFLYNCNPKIETIKEGEKIRKSMDIRCSIKNIGDNPEYLFSKFNYKMR